MSYKVLLTRPYQESVELATILKARYYESILSPLLEIKPVANLSLQSAKNYIITSQNAAQLLTCSKSHPIYSVGKKTTSILEKKGFRNIYTASGDAPSLLKLILKQAPLDQTFLHFSGEILALDIVSQLRVKGYTANQQIAYQTLYLSHLSSETLQALNNREIFAILFYSPKTSENFAKIIHSQRLEDTLSNIYALSLSPAIEDKIKFLSWKGSYSAQEKTSDSVLESLDQLRMKCHNSLTATARQ